MAMVPSTIVIPEMHLAVLAGVFHPVGLMGILAALVVVVAGGLCAAIVAQGRFPVKDERRGRAASVRPLHAAGLGSEQEDPAAA
jgi:predicted acyltransferase